MPVRNGQEATLPNATVNQIFEKIGEATAVSREAKHVASGASQKIDIVSSKIDNVAAQVNSLALVVANQGHLRDHVERLEAGALKQEAEIGNLMADKHRREGAIGLVDWISKNYPTVILLVLVAVWVGFSNGMFK
jgi:hypothetical protein